MIVVFDTNIWIWNLFLRSSAGAAVRFFLSQKRARVGLPEVIRLEVETHLRKQFRSHVGEISDKHKRLFSVGAGRAE